MKPNALVLALLSAFTTMSGNARAADDVCSRLVVYAIEQICQLLPNGQSLCQPVAMTGPDLACELPDRPPMKPVALAPPQIQLPAFPAFIPGLIPNLQTPALVNPFAAANPYAAYASAANPIVANPFAANPYLTNPYLVNPFMVKPLPWAPNPYAAAPPTVIAPTAPTPPTAPVGTNSTAVPSQTAEAKPSAPTTEALTRLMPAATPPMESAPAVSMATTPPAVGPAIATPAAVEPTGAPAIAAGKAETTSTTASPQPSAVEAVNPETGQKAATAASPAVSPAVVELATTAPAASADTPSTSVATLPAAATTPATPDVSVVTQPPITSPATTTAPLFAVAPRADKSESPATPTATLPTGSVSVAAVNAPITPTLAVPSQAPVTPVAATDRPADQRKDTLAHFEFDSAELTETGRAMLDAWLAQVSGDPPIRVTGHADRLGPEPYNEKLSLQRAESVKKYLTEKGKAAKRIEIFARGEMQPLIACPGAAAPETIACLAPNRRAEILLKPPLKAVVNPVAKKAPAKAAGTTATKPGAKPATRKPAR
jgi:outer membrane protein OmpA-like peptidoglycan-associated protein